MLNRNSGALYKKMKKKFYFSLKLEIVAHFMKKPSFLHSPKKRNFSILYKISDFFIVSKIITSTTLFKKT